MDVTGSTLKPKIAVYYKFLDRQKSNVLGDTLHNEC